MIRQILALIILSGLGQLAQAQTPVDPAPGVIQPAATPAPDQPAQAMATPAPTEPTAATPAPANADATETTPATLVQNTTDPCMNRDDNSSLCVNDRVIISTPWSDEYTNKEGTITQIFVDATAAIKYDDNETSLVDLQNVAREVNCMFGFCAGDAVQDDDGIYGRITDLFENGVAEVTYPNGEVWYLELNELTDVENDNVPPVYTWPAPRPYPDHYIYVYHFGYYNNGYGYGWPHGYVWSGHHHLHGVCPPEPGHFGYHGYDHNHPFPYHGGGTWGTHVGAHGYSGNHHGNFGGGPIGHGGSFPPVHGGTTHTNHDNGSHSGNGNGGGNGGFGGNHGGTFGGNHNNGGNNGGFHSGPRPTSNSGGGFHPAPTHSSPPSGGGGGHFGGGGRPSGGGGSHVSPSSPRPSSGGAHFGGGHHPKDDK